MWNACETGGVERERDRLEDLVIGGSMILQWVFRKWVEAWAEMFRSRMGTGGGLLLMR
jgi:hypothetical protein